MTVPNPLPFAIGSTVWPGISKLVEECGEVVQVAGKILQLGEAVRHWDGSNLRDRLTEELADVMAAVHFVALKNGLQRGEIDLRAWHVLHTLKSRAADHDDSAYGLRSSSWAGLARLVKSCGRMTELCARLMVLGAAVEREGLYLEFSDLIASILFVTGKNGLDGEGLEARAARKFKRFCDWHDSGDTAPAQPTAPGRSGS